MKRYFFLLLSAIIILPHFACITFQGNEPKGGLLWKISGNGLSQPSYLFGTWHGTDDINDDFLDSIPGINWAFDACTQFIGEVASITDSMALKVAAEKIGLKLPKDSTYADLLNKTDILFLDSVLMERLGTTSASVNLRPSQLSLILMQVGELKKQSKRGYTKEQRDSLWMKTIDISLAERAQNKGYSVQGFETVAEQLDMLFPPISLPKAAIFLIRGLREEDPAFIQELVSAYRSQDLRMILAFEENLRARIKSDDPEMQKEFDDTMNKMLAQRNQAWVDKMPSFIKDKPSFIGVGVRHLPGETGLIRLLQKEGYTVEPVR